MLGAEALRMAFANLWSHKGRSVLTILGVVIGISSVIAVTSLGASFEDSITGQFDSVDDRSIFVQAGTAGPQNGPPSAGQFGTIFTEVDRQAILGMADVERVDVAGQAAVSGITYQGTTTPFRMLTAVTPAGADVRDPTMYLTGGVFAAGENEIVLGYAIAELIGGGTPVIAGTSVTIQLTDGTKEPATVAGVLEEDPTLFGDRNGRIYAPIDVYYTNTVESPSTATDSLVYDGFTVVAAEGANVRAVRDAVKEYFKGPADAQALLVGDTIILVNTANDIQDQISGAFDQFQFLIGGIAGVSLLVGGIMIGTIMLISVTERIKEIGLMKAIGGRDRDILWMFLLEALIIGFVGSLIGILLGVAFGAILVTSLFSGDDISFVLPYDWIGYAVVMGVFTGILAGYFPARRATKVQPVEALSYE